MVATIGRSERLPRLVDRVLADPGTLEMIVVVDGPDAASVTVLEQLARTRRRLRPVPIDHAGHLGALDAGVRLATGDVVVLLDDDVLPALGTIAGHTRHHRHTSGLVVAGPMPVRQDEHPWTVATRLYAEEYDRHVQTLLDGGLSLLDVLWGGNLSMRRDDCMRVGLRSDRFAASYHEDQDLGYRLAAAGLTGCFDPALHAEHLHQRSDREFLRDARRQGEGKAALHEVHHLRLGPFRPEQLVADLPAPLGTVVRLAGERPAGEHLARALMAIGRCSARGGSPTGQLAAAKLARRIMQWRGAAEHRPGAQPPLRRR